MATTIEQQTALDESLVPSSQRLRIGRSEGTGSKPGVPDVPSDDSEEELSWKSSDDEEVGSHEESKESNDDSDEGSDNDSDETVKSGAGKDGDKDDDEDDDNDDEEEELAKDDEEDKETDTHVILTPVNPDDPQESSSMLSFVSRMLNPLNDVGVESIFTTTSSQIVSLEPP
nr:hypothetical protein [Tanacetum cinerariifolium]